MEYTYQSTDCVIRDFQDTIECHMLKQVTRYAVGSRADETAKAIIQGTGTVCGPTGNNYDNNIHDVGLFLLSTDNKRKLSIHQFYELQSFASESQNMIEAIRWKTYQSRLLTAPTPDRDIVYW